MNNIKKLFIKKNNKIKKAIQIINDENAHIALVIEKEKLIGTITDGDVRRGIIKNINLDDKVETIMNKDFLFINSKDDPNKAYRIMKSNDLRHMPVLNKNKELTDIILIDKLNKPNQLVNSVFILAGGKGSRLKNLTKTTPKPMLPINGKPILERIIEKCVNHGLRDFYISVNYLKDKIKNYFQNGKKWGINITYIEEETPLGTAGSISLLKKKIDKPLFVINGDVISDVNFFELYQFHIKNRSSFTLCSHNVKTRIDYATLKLNENNVINIKEKPTVSHSINAGIYLLNPEILHNIEYNKHLDMNELIEINIKKKNSVMAFPIYEYWKDIGLKETYFDVLIDIK